MNPEDIRTVLNGHDQDNIGELCTYYEGGDFTCSCGYTEAADRLEAWLDGKETKSAPPQWDTCPDCEHAQGLHFGPCSFLVALPSNQTCGCRTRPSYQGPTK